MKLEKRRYTKVTRGKGQFKDRIDVSLSRAGRKAIQKDADFQKLKDSLRNVDKVANKVNDKLVKKNVSENDYTKAFYSDSAFKKAQADRDKIAAALVDKYIDRHGKEMINTAAFTQIIAMAQKQVRIDDILRQKVADMKSKDRKQKRDSLTKEADNAWKKIDSKYSSERDKEKAWNKYTNDKYANFNKKLGSNIIDKIMYGENGKGGFIRGESIDDIVDSLPENLQDSAYEYLIFMTEVDK